MRRRPDANESRARQHGETGTMTFPKIVGTLMNFGFDGYLVDLRGTSTPCNWRIRHARCVLYYGRSGETHTEDFPRSK
jgi:hypothetical protein